jgi:hypothetical protein
VLQALIEAAVLAAFVLAFLVDPRLRRFAFWGALWGLTAGLWILAPPMIRVHYFAADGARPWIVLVVFFVVLFAIGGALLAFAALLPTVRVGRQSDQRSRLTTVMLPAIALPPAYVAASVGIEWRAFGALPAPADLEQLPASAIAYGAFVIAAATVCYVHRDRERAQLVRRVGVGLAIGAAVGAALLPLYGDIRPSTVAPVHSPTARTGSRVPLLVIGLDGGNWRTLEPLLEQHKVPAFEALISYGIRGDVKALWPPYWSTPAWGAILTGRPADELGVHEDLVATAPGLPMFELPLTLSVLLNPLFFVEFAMIRFGIIDVMPVPRDRLAAPVVWEQLTSAGIRTAVIRFPFTFPADDQASVVVSNRVVGDMWTELWQSPAESEGLVHPASDTERLLAFFRPLSPEKIREIRRPLLDHDWPAPRDAVVDPLEVLNRMSTIGAQMQAVAIDAVQRDSALGVLMLHIAGFDNICHAFWQYRFPDDFPEDRPAQADVDQLGPVVDHALIEIDRQIAELISAFSVRPNVLIVSDHGEAASRDYPLWKGWHASPGIFIAAGPDVPHGAEKLDVSYYDIFPTILALQGLRPAEPMRGRALVDVH